VNFGSGGNNMKRFSSLVISFLLIGMVGWIVVSLLSQSPMSVATFSTGTAEATLFPVSTEELTTFPTDNPVLTEEATPLPTIDSPLPTPFPTIDSPLPTPIPTVEEPIAEPTRSDLPPTSTPFPDLGVHLGDWQEITLQLGEADFKDFSQIAIDGNIFAAVTMTNSEHLGSTIVKIELNNGAIQRLTEYGQPRILYLFASDHRVVWTEQVPSSTASDLPGEELHIYDTNTHSESVVAQGIFQYIHYKHDIAVWQGVVNQVRGIHGYNLNTGQQFTIEASAIAHLPSLPRVCNSEWIVYLLSTTNDLPNYSTLHARNLTTQEDIQLGTAYLPKLGAINDKVACDNERVVWISPNSTAELTEPLVHLSLYDLTLRQERVINLPVLAASSVNIDNNIISTGLRESLGYDLLKDAPFDAKSTLATGSKEISDVSVSDDRWIQLQKTEDGRPRIFAAPIIRNP
jgi:hypothetical protein